jgi:hypothetical protein
MVADRYVKVILTIIALELLWLGVREGATPAHAQQKPAPQEVVIVRSLEPLVVRVPDPIVAQVREAVSVNQPLTVRTGGEPLVVDVMPGRPTQRPGN